MIVLHEVNAQCYFHIYFVSLTSSNSFYSDLTICLHLLLEPNIVCSHVPLVMEKKPFFKKTF